MRNRKLLKQYKGNRTGIMITAVTLVVLILAGAWKLKSDGGRENPAPQEEMAEHQTEEQPDTEQLETEQPDAEQPAGELSAQEQLAAFLPDYTSAPLLSTTAIRDLSMEVGSTESEIRLNWLSPSANQGSVIWKNADTGEEQTVQAQTSASTTVAGYYVNKASVKDLIPGTNYTYQVGNDDAWSPEYSYCLPGQSKDSLTFLVTSDVQIGQAELEDPEQTNERWDSVVTRLTSYVPEAQFLFHLGDQVADFGSQDDYDMFLGHLGLYGIPMAPVVGNHDVANAYSIEENGHAGGRYFYEHFNVPNRSDTGQSQYDLDGNYYFIRNETLFIVLNSSTSQSFDVMEAYVAKVVQENPDVKWRVLAQHYSPYSSVSKYQDRIDSHIREYLARAAIDNDIDLVLSGHDHIYARSAFVNRDCETLNDYDYNTGDTVVNPEGTLYVTCGTSSGCLYQPVEPEVRLMFQNQTNAPTAIRIDITDTELHLRAYLVDSWTLCDEYTIRKE